VKPIPKTSDISNIALKYCSNVTKNSKQSDIPIVAQEYCSKVTTITSKSSDFSNVTQNYCSNVYSMSGHSTITNEDCSKLPPNPKMSDISNLANEYCSKVSSKSDFPNVTIENCSNPSSKNNLNKLSDNLNLAPACCSKYTENENNLKSIDKIDKKFTGAIPKVQKFGLNRVVDSPTRFNDINSEHLKNNSILNAQKVNKKVISSERGNRGRYCAPQISKKVEIFEENVKKNVPSPKYKVTPKVKRSNLGEKLRPKKANSGQKIPKKESKFVTNEVHIEAESRPPETDQVSLPKLAKNGLNSNTVKSPELNSGKVTGLVKNSSIISA